MSTRSTRRSGRTGNSAELDGPAKLNDDSTKEQDIDKVEEPTMDDENEKENQEPIEDRQDEQQRDDDDEEGKATIPADADNNATNGEAKEDEKKEEADTDNNNANGDTAAGDDGAAATSTENVEKMAVDGDAAEEQQDSAMVDANYNDAEKKDDDKLSVAENKEATENEVSAATNPAPAPLPAPTTTTTTTKPLPRDPSMEEAEPTKEELLAVHDPTPLDPEFAKQQALIENSQPTTTLEHALYEVLRRREAHIDRLSGEINKLKQFISKRKQTYKRKRKDESAPTRALSAYNIFVQDRFSQLAKENEQALKSADTEAQLKRVPPASLVASTGNQWKELSAEEKAHYEERAREDRKRYEDQMAKYQPPDKQANRKRNKTGYNMFFSAHVLRLKQSEAGVPSERGSVARLVGNAWKQLSSEEKQFYEREADKQNGMNPVEKDDDEDDEDMAKRGGPAMSADYHPGYMHQGEMPMHMGPPMHNMHQPPHHQHDPRHQHYASYAHPMHYGQPYHAAYHDQSGQGRTHASYHQGRTHGYHQGYPPPPPRHPYENSGMGM